MREAESRLADAVRQADQAKARHLEAQKRADDLARYAGGWRAGPHPCALSLQRLSVYLCDTCASIHACTMHGPMRRAHACTMHGPSMHGPIRRAHAGGANRLIIVSLLAMQAAGDCGVSAGGQRAQSLGVQAGRGARRAAGRARRAQLEGR